MSFLMGISARTHIDTELRKAHAILYRPYEFLDHPSSPSEYPGSQRTSIIEGLIGSGQFREARHQSHQLIKTTLSGLRYLETYDRTLIRMIVTVAYTGWIAFSAVFILAPSRPLPAANHTPALISLLFGFATVGSCVLFAVQKLPWTLHVYILFPFSFWHDVTRTVYANWSAIRGHSLDTKWIASTLIGLLVAASVLQSMVVRSFHVPSPIYEILNGGPKGWVHYTDCLECWLCRYWSGLAPDILAQGQNEVPLALGCLLHHYSRVPTAFRESL